MTEEHRQFARREGLPSPDAEIGRFMDFWRAKPGKDGVKLDWDSTFRNWLRNAQKFGRSEPARKPAAIVSALDQLAELGGGANA